MKRALPKPRNPFVQHLLVKKQGAHGKSKKALRRQDKVDLSKVC
jgi:hypothetical protein